MIMNTLRKAFNAWHSYFDPLGPNQRRWVDELNSGRYPQTRMALRAVTFNQRRGAGGAQLDLGPAKQPVQNARASSD